MKNTMILNTSSRALSEKDVTLDNYYVSISIFDSTTNQLVLSGSYLRTTFRRLKRKL